MTKPSRMKIRGHTVIFGDTHWHDQYYGYSDMWDRVRRQRWDIPTLDLYGYVDPRQPLIRIQHDIESEVNKDLDNRKKKAMGIKICSPTCGGNCFIRRLASRTKSRRFGRLSMNDARAGVVSASVGGRANELFKM